MRGKSEPGAQRKSQLVKEGNEGAHDESLEVKWQESQEMRLRERFQQRGLVTDMGRYIIICALHQDVCCCHTELLPGLRAATKSPGSLVLILSLKSLTAHSILRCDGSKSSIYNLWILKYPVKFSTGVVTPLSQLAAVELYLLVLLLKASAGLG